MSPYVPAAGAALLFGLSTAVQHRAARQVPLGDAGPIRLTLLLLRNPVWVLARVADLGAVLLQAVALHTGALVAVQGVVACGIVAALVASAVLERRMPRRAEVLGAVLVVAGAVMVGRFTRAAGDDDLPSALRWVVLASILAGVAVAAALVRASPLRARVAHPSVVLGAAAGSCFALGSGFLKVGSLGVGDGLLHPAGVIGVAGFVAMAAIGNVFAQRSFQHGALAQGLPALVGAEPVAAFVVGMVLFHERVRRSGAGAIGAVGLVVIVLGVRWLGREGARGAPGVSTGAR